MNTPVFFTSCVAMATRLEPNMPMHEASSLGPVPVDNPLIADNEKRVLGDVIFTHPPSLVGANLLVNTYSQLIKLVQHVPPTKRQGQPR